MVLGSNQPLTEMRTRNIFWGGGLKVAGAKGWRYHLQVPLVLKPDSLKLQEPSGPAQACIGIALPFNPYRTQMTLLSTDKVLMNEISSANKYFVTVISVCPGVYSASKNEYQDIPGG